MRSSGGLERYIDIVEVMCSTPIVPTQKRHSSVSVSFFVVISHRARPLPPCRGGSLCPPARAKRVQPSIHHKGASQFPHPCRGGVRGGVSNSPVSVSFLLFHSNDPSLRLSRNLACILSFFFKNCKKQSEKQWPFAKNH